MEQSSPLKPATYFLAEFAKYFLNLQSHPVLPAEFERAIKVLRWSHQQAADHFQVTKKTIQNWINGEREITGPAAVLFRQVQIVAEEKRGREREGLLMVLAKAERNGLDLTDWKRKKSVVQCGARLGAK